MKKLGILFDYNGVIVTDEPLHAEAMRTVLQPHGVEISQALYDKWCFGQPDRDSFENIKTLFPDQLQQASTAELIQKKFEIYNQLITNKSILAPGIREALETLRPDFEMGIVSGALRDEIEPLLMKENLARYFKVIITAAETSKGKPNPEGYLKGLAELGLPATSVVAIEDSPAGIQAANAAGLKCIGVDQPADWTIKTISQLDRRLIEKILG